MVFMAGMCRGFATHCERALYWVRVEIITEATRAAPLRLGPSPIAAGGEEALGLTCYICR